MGGDKDFGEHLASAKAYLTASTPPSTPSAWRSGNGSPVSAFAARAGRGSSDASSFAPAAWPPDPDAGRWEAEETLAQWEGEVGSLYELAQDVGLHRVRRAAGEDSDGGSGSDEDRKSDNATMDGDGFPSDSSTLKTSTTITRVVDYIGKRLEQVHGELNSPRCPSDHTLGYDDPQHVTQQQVVFPPSRRPMPTGPCENQRDSNASLASGSPSARSGSKTVRQIEPKPPGAFPFLFARVVNEPEPEPEPETETESADMNPVSEYIWNLLRFRPGAPSRQAILIRSTHDKLALVLAQKDERIEAMHSQAIARERSCKAAEVFSVTLVAELEVILSALDLFRLTESQNWADAFRHADASHARALCELEKILKEAHANEVALLNSAMQEQQRLKDEALSRVQQLLEGEACTSDSVKKFLTDLRAKDLELANMRTLLDQKDNEIKFIQHQKATETKLLASEHLVQLKSKDAEHLKQLKSKDAELLKELETLSKAKMSEMEQALAKLRAEMKSKEDAYEALLKKKDADLANLEDKHKAEFESLNVGMSKKVDDLWAQLKAKESDYDELQRKFESSGDSLRSELDQREEALRVLQRKLEDSRGEIDRIGNERDSQKRRSEICERDSAAEIARLQAEIDRLRALLDQERERRRDLEDKLRLAEEAAKRANKLVGIGMRITDEAPHRVTELVEGGAAYLSGAIQVGDYILQVANMDASKHSIADIRNCVLGPAGSCLDLKLDRRGEDDEPNVFTVNIKRAEIMPTAPKSSSWQSAWQSAPSGQTAPELAKMVSKDPPKNIKPAAGSPPDASAADAATKKKKVSYVPGPFF